MDLLKKAAAAWQELYKIKYSITYGKKRKLYDVDITFKKSDFYHLAGFQYLDDLDFPNIPPNVYIDSILKNEIKGSFIEKGVMYEEIVKSRLLALADLQQALDKNIELYVFNRANCPFHTVIEASNLILGNSKSNDIFVFLVKNEDRYVCSSIFLKQERDYSKNQIPLSILRIVKTNLKTQEQTVFIDKLND
jgi:hypothetical protein